MTALTLPGTREETRLSITELSSTPFFFFLIFFFNVRKTDFVGIIFVITYFLGVLKNENPFYFPLKNRFWAEICELPFN